MQETHVVLVGVATDVAMAALKLTVGLAAGSRALVADALHSLSDVVSDGVTLAGLRAARRPPDEEAAALLFQRIGGDWESYPTLRTVRSEMILRESVKKLG